MGSRRLVVADSMLDLIGGTPLVRLRRQHPDEATLWAKLESLNPAGSVKDRVALAMIEAAETQGLLQPGGVVVEPTSGNTGIGLAQVCAVKGYRCILTMPASMSLERRQLLEAFGAQIVLTPEDQQMEGAISAAQALARTTEGAFLPGQFDNPENPRVHATTTAQEILEALPEGLDAFVAGVGTGGTISGVGAALRRGAAADPPRPAPLVVAVEPESCATLSRGERGPTKIQGLAPGFVPPNYDPSVVDRVVTVTDDEAWETKVRLARDEGLLVGISAGAAVHGARRIARELGPSRTVVTVLCDTGERYFSLEEYFR